MPDRDEDTWWLDPPPSGHLVAFEKGQDGGPVNRVLLARTTAVMPARSAINQVRGPSDSGQCHTPGVAYPA